MQNTPSTSFEPFSSRSLPKPSHQRTLSVANTPGASRDSSLQKVWADDYYAEDFAGGIALSFEQGIPSPPALAALPRSIPLSAEEEPQPARQPRTHQRSLTDLLPFRTPHPNSKSPERSPVKQRIEDEFMSTLTGDRDGMIKVADKSKGGLASWFTGSSAPVALGVPVGGEELPPPPSMSSSRSTSPERQPGKLQKRPTLQTMDSTSSVSTTQSKPQTSRFNFFSPKTPIKNTIQLPADMMNDDEFLSLDVTQALFPQGNAQDPFSPASFKNLLMNAEGILLKLQTAYKLRTLSLHELSADKSAIEEELEEASTRATCLRTQLEDMASRVSEQDAKVADLTAQLEREKQARTAEKEAREKSIALIQASARDSRSYNEVPDILSEDLGISNAHGKQKKWRGSADLSTEGDSDTESESVFSRSRSPTFTTASVSTMASTPELGQAEFTRTVSNTNPPSQRPRLSLQQKSTFQKFLQGITPAVVEEDDKFGGIGMGVDGCTNCRGKDASVAWDTVGLLRAENKGLKEQVGILEGGVDGALAFCYTMSHSE
ncbi:hypothetical protein LHYA1_G002555 [Lachnellula hyalina]|uniref:Uncharacterized protein n=1 Tax=Lachnellula hyalina TaxID=1316788 RepID=A0A8H8R802_9HELO|nr:uncharacterized protein LHYA1_G002555 [Lachnellula hyalina]TVY30040.1 hypothetical protein LHYA1_G002555 [Lachnellula hyalina]